MESGIARVVGLFSLMAVALMQSSALAQERPWSFSLDSVASYNDNRDGTSDGEGIIETRFNAKADWRRAYDKTDVDVFYAPQFLYRDNPREDQNSTDLYHDFGLNIVRRWSERLRMTIDEGFSLSDTSAELIGERTFHEFVTYWVNRTSVRGSYALIPNRSVISAGGNYMMKRYQDDEYAEIGDEDTAGAGVAVKYLARSGWSLLGDVVYASSSLGSREALFLRDCKTVFVGVGAERVFGLLTARVRAGMDRADFTIVGVQDEGEPGLWYRIEGAATSPGGDLNLAYAATDRTRFDCSVGYHMLRSDISPFAAQKRASVSVHAWHRFTGRIGAGLQLEYARGTYDDLPVLTAGGDDAVMAFGVDASYELSMNMQMKAGYRYEDWTADEHLRTPYNRNVVTLAVGTRF